MKKHLTILIGIGQIMMFTGCASTITPGNQGLMWRPFGSGLDQEQIYDDGVVWHWPWNNVLEYELQLNSYQEEVRILTADDLHMSVTVTVVLKPILQNLPELVLEIGSEYYSRLVRPDLYTITRNVMANYAHNKLPENSPAIEEAILDDLRERLEGKYLDIDDIVLDHIMYSPLVAQAADKKLATLQRLEQKEYEIGIARKDAEIQRISAGGQRDAQKIINEGLTKKYLQFESLAVQRQLSTSSNAKFYFIPLGEDGLPVIIDTGEK